MLSRLAHRRSITREGRWAVVQTLTDTSTGASLTSTDRFRRRRTALRDFEAARFAAACARMASPNFIARADLVDLVNHDRRKAAA